MDVGVAPEVVDVAVLKEVLGRQADGLAGGDSAFTSRRAASRTAFASTTRSAGPIGGVIAMRYACIGDSANRPSVVASSSNFTKSRTDRGRARTLGAPRPLRPFCARDRFTHVSEPSTLHP